eukprot:CAMPEP_0119320664 /NCGR_PEP_ID=MMETSP1333-20130426/53063_1 /TAXON_ID=418940 /ORGANISM="Scyphosphaera apsteinii, Strain RCC1455" /LENGTH=145 /DNA_ID=CAMNT_0007327427 /DNA_START=72 /DNA_END=509 /DNA_ORIENTATION=+
MLPSDTAFTASNAKLVHFPLHVNQHRMAAHSDRHQWFVKTEMFIRTKSFSEIKPHLVAHKQWVAALRAEGQLITSGYRVDADGKPGGGGLMLFAANSYVAAAELVQQDPLILNGCVDWQLNRWIAEVGDIALVDGGSWYSQNGEI